MTVEIVEKEPEEYEGLVRNSKYGMLYQSSKYLNLLNLFIDAKLLFIIYKYNDCIKAAMPIFIKSNQKYGNVANSLPFYGSHGGVLLVDNLYFIEKIKILKEVLAYFKEEFVNTYDVSISTIITTPFEENVELYKNILKPDFIDSRIGQIATLPSIYDEQVLLYMFNKKCRNAVRKAIKCNVSINIMGDYDENLIDKLYYMHVKHMESVNGIPKPLIFFEKINDFFELNKDYKIYYATYNDNIIAMALLFYYKDVVEYYTPVVDSNHRSLNPMNLIIFKAMLDAVKDGFKLWNFGGTWKSQTGVYRFKKSFGAKDFSYYYFINIYSDISELLTLTPSEIQKEYRWFYVIPFNILKRCDRR